MGLGPGPILAEPGRLSDSGPPGLGVSAGLWASKSQIDQVLAPHPVLGVVVAREPAWPPWWSVHTAGPLGAPHPDVLRMSWFSGLDA